MEKKRLEKYHKLLEQRRKRLLEAYNKNKKFGTEAAGENAADMGDMAANASAKEFLYSLSNADRELLFSVEEALQRIVDTEFGECVECEETVSAKRLEAIPW